jgi:hypothetical protein
MTISKEQARQNVIEAYTKQLTEGVSVLSAAIERVKNNKAAVVKAETVSDSKPSLASLLLAESEE